MNFTTRSSEGSDQDGNTWITEINYFNPRSREGSDLKWMKLTKMQKLFQSTLPRRERHKRAWLIPMVENFNPRPREGSDNKAKEAGLTVNAISIHAPVKGATWHCFLHKTVFLDFNPRPREGSDTWSAWPKSGTARFQSTPPWRERRGLYFIMQTKQRLFQSTPPWRERHSHCFSPF